MQCSVSLLCKSPASVPGPQNACNKLSLQLLILLLGWPLVCSFNFTSAFKLQFSVSSYKIFLPVSLVSVKTVSLFTIPPLPLISQWPLLQPSTSSFGFHGPSQNSACIPNFFLPQSCTCPSLSSPSSAFVVQAFLPSAARCISLEWHIPNDAPVLRNHQGISTLYM